MKILIKKVLLPLFFTLGGDWTPDTDEAASFESGVNAIEFCQKKKVKGGEIFYKFDKPDFDFTIDAPSEEG